MTTKRLFAIMFIFVMTALAWVILGRSLAERTKVQGPAENKVAKLWGKAQNQAAPVFQVNNGGKLVNVQPDASKLDVQLNLEYRRVGLLWYPVYGVVFDGVYDVVNTGDKMMNYAAKFTPPADAAHLDEFRFEVGGKAVEPAEKDELQFTIEPGQTQKVNLHYVSRGMDRWTYNFGSGFLNVRNFELTVHTDFRNIDFKTLSPSRKQETDRGWDLVWDYNESRFSDANITIEMPQRQNPGVLAGRISYFAPVSLLFFLTVMVVITVIKKIEIHPMNYFFIAAAFFGFHLLLAYLVDHIDAQTAFVISAIVSVFLVVTYLRLVTGARFALLYAGMAQVIFLIGFSYAFFFEGFSGLAVTIGALVTLFVLMQVTGKLNWNDVLGDRNTPPNIPSARPIPQPPLPPAH